MLDLPAGFPAGVFRDRADDRRLLDRSAPRRPRRLGAPARGARASQRGGGTPRRPPSPHRRPPGRRRLVRRAPRDRLRAEPAQSRRARHAAQRRPRAVRRRGDLVAVRLWDPHPDSLVAPFPRRDDETTSDWVFVEIDSRFDRRSGFSFGVNPRGVQADGAWSADVDYDPAWNGAWASAARIDSAGWTVEYRIEFSQLALGRSRPGLPLTWGINFYRTTPHRGETSNWAPRLPSVVGIVSHFNALFGISVPPRRAARELTAYSALTGTRSPEPSGAAENLSASAGGDFRFRPTSATTLAMSLYPDFGQVEADPSQ